MADGYARASGRVGVAIATSGPGATNMVTGIATAMMDSSPIVCITGQVGSRLIGSDAFQETDITGITLPITKHNYLVTRAEDVAPAVREAFHDRRSGPARPGADRHHQGRAAGARASSTGRRGAAPDRPARRRAEPSRGRSRRPLALINRAERPLILAGHGIMLSRRRGDVLRSSPSRRTIPVAMTLLGIGGFPASHPLNLGMMGMHGEAWVNTAIQEADLLHRASACASTTASPATSRPTRRTPRRSTSTSTPRRSTRTCASTSASSATCATSLERLLPRVAAGERGRVARATSTALKGDSAVRDIQNLPDDGHLYAAHVINDHLARSPKARAPSSSPTSASTRCGRRSTTTTTRRARSSRRAASARWASRCRRRSARRSRGPDAEVWAVVGDGGFQMTMCELATVVQERLDDQGGDHQQRLSSGWCGSGRSSSTSAATPPRRSAQSGLREAGRGVRHHGVRGHRRAARSCRRSRDAARARTAPVVIDFRVEQEDTVYPMVPAGADLHAMIRRPSPSWRRSGRD